MMVLITVSQGDEINMCSTSWHSAAAPDAPLSGAKSKQYSLPYSQLWGDVWHENLPRMLIAANVHQHSAVLMFKQKQPFAIDMYPSLLSHRVYAIFLKEALQDDTVIKRGTDG